MRVNKTNVKRGVITFLTERICQYCGKPFVTRKNKVAQGIGNYCSHSCSMKSRKTKSEIVICGNCGVEFKLPNCRIKSSKFGVNFCSVICRAKIVNLRKKTTTRAKLLSGIKIDLLTGCWLWQKCRNADGYGTMMSEYLKSDRCHRISYRLYIGEIPDGKLIMHSCDNPQCCSPFHLSLGTQDDNMKDMVAKGRHVIARGGALFTHEQEDKIRANFKGLKGEKLRLSRELCVSPTTITNILERKTRW